MFENINKKGNDRIKLMRLRRGYTLAKLAEIIGVSDATLQRYESGKIQNIKLSTISKLAEALKCDKAYLMGIDYQPGSDIFSFDNIIPTHKKNIPVLGEIACGEPIYCADTGIEFTLGQDINADFCLIAKGDSMINARIYDGDVVFIKEQCNVENGEIAAVIINDEATLKRVYRGDNVITLTPENPKYSPIVFTGDEINNVRILGKAVGMQTKKLYM